MGAFRRRRRHFLLASLAAFALLHLFSASFVVSAGKNPIKCGLFFLQLELEIFLISYEILVPVITQAIFF